MRPHRSIAAVTAFCAAMPGLAHTQEVACGGLLEDQSITVYVPYEAGGGYDREARLVGPMLSAATGSKVNIVNLVGLDGQLAMRAVLQSDPTRETVIGYFNSTSILNTELAGASETGFSAFVPIGSLNSDYRALGGRAGIDFTDPGEEPILVSAFSSEGFMSILTDLTGANTISIRGYSGSNDAFGAVARGDLDLVLTGAQGMERNLETFDTLEATLFLGPGEASPFEGRPYLIGPGGVAETLLDRVPEGERDRVQRDLELLTYLTVAHRVFAGHGGLDAAVVSCLSDTLQTILTSPEMQEQAAAVRSVLKPLDGPAVQIIFDKLSDMVVDNADVLADYGVLQR